MMDRKRIAVVTAGLAGAGMVVGGVLGGGLGLAAMLLFGGVGGLEEFPEYVLAAALSGALAGAVLGPLAAWLLMRHVPLGLAIGGTALGTLAGVAATFVIGGNLLVTPLLGFGLSALAMRLLVGRKERAGIPTSGG
jgi:hypothetical protein